LNLRQIKFLVGKEKDVVAIGKNRNLNQKQVVAEEALKVEVKCMKKADFRPKPIKIAA
jgi:hypothetical protein